jgi:hypothetical protein
MKIKKGLKEVKEMLSPHHHHHHHQHHPDGHGEQQHRRKSGPTESPRRGPLAPVLDHLEKHNSVPIHLRSFSVARKGSSSSYSCSDITPDESATLADIHQHIEQEQEQVQQVLVQEQEQAAEQQPSSQPEEPLQPEPQPEMETEVPEPYVSPPSPQRSNDGEETPNPFLVDDPEDELSDPGSPTPAPVPPLDPGSLLPETSPSESVALSPAPSELVLPAEPVAPAVDKPVPALPVVSDTESEQEAPAVHLPQLVMPTMFLPIPNVRISSHLTWWLTRRTPVYY